MDVGGVAPATAFTIVGVVHPDTAQGLETDHVAGFDLPSAQRLLGLTGRYSEIAVAAKPGVAARATLFTDRRARSAATTRSSPRTSSRTSPSQPTSRHSRCSPRSSSSSGRSFCSSPRSSSSTPSP